MSLETSWSSYCNSCVCGESFSGKNCAHYLSNAFIKGGFTSIDGGEGALFRTANGFCVCKSGRPVRAKELRKLFFAREWSLHTEPQEGMNLVYQEKSDGQGHVLMKRYDSDKQSTGYKGTEDYPTWPVQEYYY